MITNAKELENGWVLVERDNAVPSHISLNSGAGDGHLERWDNNYVYVRTGDYRFIYNEEGHQVNSERVF